MRFTASIAGLSCERAVPASTLTTGQQFLQVVGQTDRKHNDRKCRVRDPGRGKHRGPRAIKVLERVDLEIRVDHTCPGINRHTRRSYVVPVDDQLTLNKTPVLNAHRSSKLLHRRLV